jgi:hypothetical protein
MANAAALSDSRNSIAPDESRAQFVAQAILRKVQAGVVCRRTWPTDDTLSRLQELDADPRLRRTGLIDSTRDLRNGLSVVEVFATSPDAAAAFDTAEIALS